MTVCTAAIAEGIFIVGASDRMLTAADIEFEPPQAKVWVFTTSIFALIAGDAGIQAEIFMRVQKDVQSWMDTEPNKWINVRDVAANYCKHYRELRREKAEAEILHPFGLDLNTFLARQSSMHGDQVSVIADKLAEYDFPSFLETIFVGKDHNGPPNTKEEKLVYCHLYVTERDKLSCMTTVGFAAIGIGKTHAESQFMFSGHSPSKPFHETVLLAYAAKKRAEVAPGVGKETDMIVIGPDVGNSLKVDEKHIKKLEKIYQKNRRAASKALEVAQTEAKQFIDGVRSEYEQEQQRRLEEVKKLPPEKSDSQTSKISSN